jgi:hypothetical protein
MTVIEHYFRKQSTMTVRIGKIFGSPEPFFQKGFWPSETKKVLIEFYRSFRMGRQNVF